MQFIRPVDFHKMQSRAFQLAWLWAVALIGFDANARSAAVTTNALIAATCGPTDGPATTLLIVENSVTCDDWKSLYAVPHISAETWHPLNLVAGPAIDLLAPGGAVSICKGSCEQAAKASLKIDQVTSDGFGGTLDVTTKAHGLRHVPVHARRCSIVMICG